MGYFNRDSNNRNGRDNRGGGRGFGGGRGGGFGRSDDRPREMFKTVCSNCGKDCEVPFKPTTGKPVYCSDCFEKMGGRSTDTRPERPERNRSSFNDRPQTPRVDYGQQFESLNKKMDRIIELLTPKIEMAKSKEVSEVKPDSETIPEVKTVKTPKVKKTTKKVVEKDKDLK